MENKDWFSQLVKMKTELDRVKSLLALELWNSENYSSDEICKIVNLQKWQLLKIVGLTAEEAIRQNYAGFDDEIDNSPRGIAIKSAVDALFDRVNDLQVAEEKI